jgi:hypothetical protein
VSTDTLPIRREHPFSYALRAHNRWWHPEPRIAAAAEQVDSAKPASDPIRGAEARPLTPPPLAKPHADDGKLVQVSMFVTSGGRHRLKKLGLSLGNRSLQRLGHRTWVALAASGPYLDAAA